MNNKIIFGKIVPVIKITGMIGTGSKEDPVSMGEQYWSIEGKVIATLTSIEDDERIGISSGVFGKRKQKFVKNDTLRGEVTSTSELPPKRK